MLPGGGLARLAGRRRVHYHCDDVAACSAEHAHHYAHHAAAHHVEGPALAARIRLEEKLRGAALPSSTASASTSTSTSRWSRLMRDGRSSPRHPQSPSTRRDEQQDTLPVPATAAEPEPWLPAPPNSAALLQQAAAAAADMPASARRQRRAELTRTLSKVDVCAVCLEEVREGRQRVTRLPCSHKYHTECVLPWLATHPDCPCCRALVPSADTLV